MFSQIKELIENDKNDAEELKSKIISKIMSVDWGK